MKFDFDLGKRRLSGMKSEWFDKKFDNGEDISNHLDFANATRPGREQKRVNVDFPVWMIQSKQLGKDSRTGEPLISACLKTLGMLRTG